MPVAALVVAIMCVFSFQVGMIKVAPVTFSLLSRLALLSGVGLGIQKSVDAVVVFFFRLAISVHFMLQIVRSAVEKSCGQWLMSYGFIFDWSSNTQRCKQRISNTFLLLCGCWSNCLRLHAGLHVRHLQVDTNTIHISLVNLVELQSVDSFCQKQQNLRFLRPFALYVFCLFVSLFKCFWVTWLWPYRSTPLCAVVTVSNFRRDMHSYNTVMHRCFCDI